MATLSHPVVPRPAVYGLPVPNGPSNAPPGTFLPGTKVQVGNHRVIIEKYLSEGGFAHVYVVRVPGNVDKTDTAVLKRVAVPDKEALADMRTEVETMKKLKGHKHIVSYIDSHASQMKGGGYEVFLLMEYCAGGGLIDFMNTRLQHRLTEPEIIKIFADIAEGVACMHYLKPPLLHRDLKVENVLISNSGSSTLYKLCDFGSTAPPRPAARTAAEGLLIEDDVQKHTTLQYRSPEMIDVYRKQPIDEKSDIWALGVLLYKLCYYTTPFEELGQMAILTASFKYPAYPSFSNKIKLLIASMLREDPKQRPNIYQVVKQCCAMRGVEVPIKDIYENRSQSETRRNEQLPSPTSPIASPPAIGAFKSPPIQVKQVLPEITPMRRGRPSAPVSQQNEPKPGISPSRAVAGDPFAALESTSVSVRSAAVDELAAKFPSLDDFSLLHDKSSNFDFSTTAPATQNPKMDKFKQRVTNALADQAFAQPTMQKSEPASRARTPPAPQRSASVRKSPPDGGRPKPRRKSPSLRLGPSDRPAMVSVGTMTSPSPVSERKDIPKISAAPVWRVPPLDHRRASSQPRASTGAMGAPAPSQSVTSRKRESGLLQVHQQKSRAASNRLSDTSTSSHPSVEGQLSSATEVDASIHRSKSATIQRPRPSSEFIDSNLDYLRERENPRKAASPGHSPAGRRVMSNGSQPHVEESAIASDMEFLRAMEDKEGSNQHLRRSSSGAKHSKRASLPSLSLSGTKNMLAGRFGEAFKRFEASTATPRDRTPSPSRFGRNRQPEGLSPVTASDTMDVEEAMDLEETVALSPEVRRELERRKLAEEERRVEAMAAEHKRRVAERGSDGLQRGPSKASTIQNRVRTLLDESGRVTPIKTAEGYGRYADGNGDLKNSDLSYPKPSRLQQPQRVSSPTLASSQQQPLDTGLLPESKPPASRPPSLRPAAPPKPKALRAVDVRNPSAQLQALMNADARPDPKDARGAATSGGAREQLNTNGFIGDDAEDVLATFSKRYPSVSGLEVGETSR